MKTEAADSRAGQSVSIVVTVKNADFTLGQLLTDLEALDWPAKRLEVVLVDAHSTDGTWPLIESFAARAAFRVVAVQRPGNIGAGRNEGFRLARGEFVAVTDADMRVPSDWIRELLAGMSDGIGVVGGPNDAASDDLTSRCIAALPVHGPSLGIVPLFRKNKYLSDYETDSDIYAAVTRNSLFRKEAVEKVGGFDESLVVTEDPELMYRILGAGYRLRYRKDAGVRHVHRDGLLKFYRQQRGYAVWQAVADRKNPGMFSVKQILPLLAAVTFLATLALAFLSPLALYAALTELAAGLLLVAYYAVRAALGKRDPALLVALPPFFLAWQLAWVTGFPAGLARRRGPPRTT